jgi:hypothetical protein
MWSGLHYTRIDEVFDLVRGAGGGATIIKKDLKDAFRMIAVAPHQRWLLGFQWQGRFYHENCLPFGLRTAPLLFNLLAEGLQWVLQSLLHWEHLAHYLDDFIYVLPSSTPISVIETAERDYVELTNALGLLRNDSKDASGTKVEALGIEIDTVAMTARISARKIAKARSLVSTALTKGNLTQLQTQKIIGFLSFCASVVTLGRTYLRRLWDYASTFARPQSFRKLTAGAVADLTWWRDLLPRFNGVRLIDNRSRQTYHLFTDASNYAMGAFWYAGSPADGDWPQFSRKVPQQQSFSYSYEPRERSLHINVTEILVIELAFERWGTLWEHGTVIAHTDNTTAEAGLKGGTTKSAGMEQLRNILLLAATRDTALHACRITTEANTLADALSRLDWKTVADFTSNWQIPSHTNRSQSSSAC